MTTTPPTLEREDPATIPNRHSKRRLPACASRPRARHHRRRMGRSATVVRRHPRLALGEARPSRPRRRSPVSSPTTRGAGWVGRRWPATTSTSTTTRPASRSPFQVTAVERAVAGPWCFGEVRVPTAGAVRHGSGQRGWFSCRTVELAAGVLPPYRGSSARLPGFVLLPVSTPGDVADRLHDADPDAVDTVAGEDVDDLPGRVVYTTAIATM